MSRLGTKMIGRTAQYGPISTSDELEQQTSTDEKWSASFSARVTASRRVCVGALLLFLAAVSFATWSHSVRRSTNRVLPCGTSADEARSRGCVFEVIGSSWVTPECYDPVTEEEFLSFREWHFYRDYNYTEEVSIAEVRQGNGNGFFVSHGYHQAHCAFLWKKMHRAFDAGRKLDGLIQGLSHTTHCVDRLLHPPKDDVHIPTFAYTKFPNCGIEGGFNLDGTILKPESTPGVNYIDTHLLPGGHQHQQSSP